MPKSKNTPNRGYDPRLLPSGHCFCMYEPYESCDVLELKQDYVYEFLDEGGVCPCIIENNKKFENRINYLKKKAKKTGSSFCKPGPRTERVYDMSAFDDDDSDYGDGDNNDDSFGYTPRAAIAFLG
ncbi:uncharacterized protein EV154DRAFT_485832 [Mucor mucedo]|uniref:uncharacterized protein n=1 Tax=Mucor mucedo TaxID=29922 RepID=UPI00221FAFBC|nr:uncharacterized protein EV154DRAFT_485832 [Mucor mucedo]KAI7880887.1 hypothetical protein EV154DRAFT_485832 [Mucor mucedo]